ncbi:MAG: hypothetical protein Q8L26_05465 [Candidatus Omnitrophota bacterium]|nr:hypothetical protein [Candidatus Omnitrophota bacterium]
MYLTKKSALKQEYIVIGIVAFAALALVIGFFIIFIPLVEELSSLNSKIRKGEKIAPDASGYRRQYAEMEKQIETLSQEITQSKERLFWKRDITFFLGKLSHVAEQLAVDFISIRPSLTPEPVKADNKEGTVLMYKHAVNITMKAGYRELIGFLARIEESDRFFRIDELTIVPDTKDILKRNVTLVLSVFSAD